MAVVTMQFCDLNIVHYTYRFREPYFLLLSVSEDLLPYNSHYFNRAIIICCCFVRDFFNIMLPSIDLC